LCRFPLGTRGFCLTSEGHEAAWILWNRDAIHVESLDGGSSGDIRVQGAKGLVNLDPLPEGAGFLSRTSDNSRPRALLLIRRDGKSHVLWAPTEVLADFAIAARDGKHLAITAEVPHSNAWMLSGF
jgi:hypothetical protein